MVFVEREERVRIDIFFISVERELKKERKTKTQKGLTAGPARSGSGLRVRRLESATHRSRNICGVSSGGGGSGGTGAPESRRERRGDRRGGEAGYSVPARAVTVKRRKEGRLCCRRAEQEA